MFGRCCLLMWFLRVSFLVTFLYGVDRWSFRLNGFYISHFWALYSLVLRDEDRSLTFNGLLLQSVT